jgi:lipoate-protein ligase A
LYLLDLTLPTPEENIALDEAILDAAENRDNRFDARRGVLRLWESPQPLVVIGRSSRREQEVDREVCEVDEVPVLRRSSGGAAIVAGPGCLMYAVVLSYEEHPHLRALEVAHAHVLRHVQMAVSKLVPETRMNGTSDLEWRGQKFSGNSLRCKREHLLYHGTLLYDFPLPLISRYLKTPPRQPDYRHGRDHDAFVTNLPCTAAMLRRELIAAWKADEPLAAWPAERTAKLVADRYSRESWHGDF